MNPGKFRYRFERFGGVLAVEKPAMLTPATRAFMKKLGLDGCAEWSGSEESVPGSPRPSRRISRSPIAATRGARTATKPRRAAPGELAARDARSRRPPRHAGVFHIALGGGEVFSCPGSSTSPSVPRSRESSPNSPLPASR